MYLSMICPRMGEGGGGATPRKLTFKLAPWEGILTVKYLLTCICTNYKGLYENLTSGEHSGEGNLKFSSQKSQIPRGLSPPPPILGQTIDRCIKYNGIATENGYIYVTRVKDKLFLKHALPPLKPHTTLYVIIHRTALPLLLKW